MKGIDIFCASQASTAIYMPMDQPSSSTTTTTDHGGSSPAIDRHNPIIRDTRRITRALAPCSSQPPIVPKPLHHHLRKEHRKISSSKKTTLTKQAKPADQVPRKGTAKLGGVISPPGSTRYLLGDGSFYDVFPDFDPGLGLGLVRVEPPVKSQPVNLSEPSSSSQTPDLQEVVLRVSLHCKGCEGKLRKHISRMQGVKSFEIDFAAKKVTVVGDVTPLSVLASVSKVKSAKFWTSAMPPPAPSTVGPGYMALQK